MSGSARGESGQALLLLLGLMLLVAFGAVAYGEVAKGIAAGNRVQGAADLAALAGGRSMERNFDRLFQQSSRSMAPSAAAMDRATHLREARTAALRVAVANGVEKRHVEVRFPDSDQIAPTRIKITIVRPHEIQFSRHRSTVKNSETATAELSAPELSFPEVGKGNQYGGPLAYRQGEPMRPDVAVAFDRMYSAAKRDGVPLTINSAFRSNAEQAILFAAHPDPKWVAPPGTSLHRMGTELDLGPPGSMPWVAAHAQQFHFVQRYSWEEWHFGYTLNAGSNRAMKAAPGKRGDHGVLQSFVPARYAPMITDASQRWNVSSALLAAQLYAESGFNERATSPVGAQGIAQFMPGTARSYGIDPFDPKQAINGQAHLMRDLLRQFGEVRLALAAYNAGPAPVSRCNCVPPYPETQAYVVRILGLLKGAGEVGLTGSDIASVRLIE